MKIEIDNELNSNLISFGDKLYGRIMCFFKREELTDALVSLAYETNQLKTKYVNNNFKIIDFFSTNKGITVEWSRKITDTEKDVVKQLKQKQKTEIKKRELLRVKKDAKRLGLIK